MASSRARSSTLTDPGESFVELLAAGAAGRLLRAIPTAQHPRIGIGDDAAVLADGTLVTTDTMVEGTHWDSKLSAEDVGYKLVAVNVSDIDAMGGRPTWATLALSLPVSPDAGWLSAFFHGFELAAGRFGVQLVGGDTTRSTAGTVATLTLAGTANNPIRRSTAVVGDTIWVTGDLGLAAEAMLHPAPSPKALAHLRRPAIPAPLGAFLAENDLVHAMMDLSDGLARDLGRLCRASGCGAIIQPNLLPTTQGLDRAVAYGEDYGLLFTAPATRQARIESAAAANGSRVTAIGMCTDNAQISLAGHAEWPGAGFSHFAGMNR